MEVPLTPLAFLDRARDLFASRVGVIDGDLRLDYAAFAARTDRLAHALRRDLGVEPGDRVAWVCGNTHELLEAYFGVLRAGAVLVPLNIRLAGPELSAILRDCSPTVLFRHPAEVAVDTVVPVVEVGPEYEDLLARQPDTAPPDAIVDERSAAEIFYTSGTTGTPKGAVLTHRNLYLHAVHSALTNGLDGTDVILHTIPLFHVNGWGTPHYVTALGGVHVMLPRFDAAEVLRLVEAERVTRLFLVPTMAARILEEPALADRDMSALRQVSVGGAPTPETVLAELEDRLGCPCVCGYGMTEASPTITRSLDKPGEAPSRARRATTGLPILGVEVSVRDEHGREVARDGATPGEILTRSNHVMSGYWNDEAATDAVIKDGWLHTGDVATVDADGYLTIIDRTKDVIVSGGENVSSVEVEKALTAHPAVSEAAVVGVPDPTWGEVPAAFVTLRSEATAEPAELVLWVRERLAHFKAPKSVTIVDDLPRSGTGKVRKADLRARSEP